MKTALTIAGSDSSGGAGIQADLKAMTMNGVFAMSAITALTAQNTTGVSGIFEVSPKFLAGSDLIASDAVRTLRRELFPLAEVITPNRHEAEVLSGLHISGRADMSAAARAIAADCGCAVLLKGGHSDTDADDLLTFPDGTEIWFPGKRIANPNTHGTGCTLSSAIAANLAKGFALEEAIARAKAYLTDALNAQLDLGHGSGPLDHTLGGVGVENWMHGVPDAVHK